MSRIEWQCECKRWNVLGVKSCSDIECLKPKPLNTPTKQIPDLARKQAELWNRKLLGINHRNPRKRK